jgi:hypothetical protein
MRLRLLDVDVGQPQLEATAREQFRRDAIRRIRTPLMATTELLILWRAPTAAAPSSTGQRFGGVSVLYL